MRLSSSIQHCTVDPAVPTSQGQDNKNYERKEGNQIASWGSCISFFLLQVHVSACSPLPVSTAAHPPLPSGTQHDSSPTLGWRLNLLLLFSLGKTSIKTNKTQKTKFYQPLNWNPYAPFSNADVRNCPAPRCPIPCRHLLISDVLCLQENCFKTAFPVCLGSAVLHCVTCADTLVWFPTAYSSHDVRACFISYSLNPF